MTLALRERLVATARRMSDLGLTPGLSGNASVRTASGFLITPSAMPYADLHADDLVELRADGTARPDQRTPSSEWQLHRDLLAARPGVEAIVHTHSLYCTSIACLRRSIPAVHYMIALAGTDEIPCADYATYGSAELAANVLRALGTGDACLMANHGMVALGRTLDAALRLAAEVETLAGQYWHASAIGTPHVLPADELARVRAKFATHGQKKRR
ncbi:MAG TPA: class II aldolase/adducin family protein [Kofleriaceae bacterium]|nr:class II aldolase/adducin family protein [Kofleriaceae bacterium]